MPNKTENLAKKISRREKRRQNFFKEVYQPTIFGKKSRSYRGLSWYQREKWNNLVKMLKSRKAKASFLIGVLLFAMVSGIFFNLILTNIDVVFKGNKCEADVNEDVTFSWSVIGSFSKGAIVFGDGISVELNNTSNSVRHSYTVQGKYSPLIHVWNQNGFSTSKALFIEINNKAPQFQVSVANTAYEDEHVIVSVVDLVESEVDLEYGVLKYAYDFADNNQTTSNQKSIVHKWENSGIYPVSITIFDDQNALTQKTEYIEIVNKAPKAYFDHVITEEVVEFNAELSFDTKNDYNSMMYIWDFGDNHTAFGKYVNHAYDTPGQYAVELCVKDDNGAVDYTSKLLNIASSQTNGNDNNEPEEVINLEVLGPFTLPQNFEGQMVNLDVEVYDSLANEPTLSYSWYDQNGEQISTNKRSSILLDDGDYRFTLNVSNQNGQTVSENITSKVNNIAPEVFVSNYAYNGPNIDSSKRAELELTAYGYDSIFDINKLKFYWEITDGDTNYTYSETFGKATSTMIFTCTETSIYRGQVKVVDPSGKESVAIFFVNVIIDNNKNSVPDNIEQLLEITGESLETFADADNDLISDEYEQWILGTNFVNPDTDGDGLCDGLDAFGIGELSIGTNPLNEDSDYDLLKDSIEFYGWNVSINFFEGSKTLLVSSEPLIFDTDGDGLSDYEEYQIGSNPRLKDSDGDLLEDSIDPFPINFDQDADFLSDKIEIDIGTDVNNSDSDMDGIKDGEEYYGWGLLGFKTNPLEADCDRDFASDGSEMKFYTVTLENPNNHEIRVNVSNPVSLHFPYMFQKAATAQISVALSFGEHGTNETGEYGIKDENVKNLTVTIRHEGYNAILFETTTNRTRYFSHVIDVSEIMNNDSLSFNYYGNYILEVNDPSAGCLVEQFELEFCRYLDPHDEDFDKDGILDGVEMNLLVEGTQKIDVKDMYDTTQRVINSTEFNSNTTTTYRLDIPQIGRIFSAELHLAFESIGLIHAGTIIEVELAKKYVDNRLEKSILIDITQQNSYDNYESYSKTFDLFELFQDKSILDVYGEYSFTIRLESSEANQDQLSLTEFCIETDTYIEAEPLDTHAWITDPALSDTDADGWNDSYEIFTTNTNPLNKDTDGDGAFDPKDRDPLRNIILEISPIFASYRNQAWPTTDPLLKIGMYIQINDITDPNGLDEDNKVGFFTTNKRATTEAYGVGAYITHHTAWWNGGAGYHYYIDISDDVTMQSDQVQFFFTLWEDIWLGDLNRFGGEWYSDSYDLDSSVETQALVALHTGQFGRTDEIMVNVKKITVDKVNTIAIYSENDTLFNGHYQQQERMNVFQLHIIDSGTGTPFVQGANAIVIPTSLFTKTKLNAFIENGLLDQTILYSDIEGEFEFYSIDRDGNIVDEECGDVDFVFVRYQMTSQEAMELLELLLTCAINQTLDENNQTITDLNIVYTCVSTKLNGTSAVLLNVPNTVSKFILWSGGYEDSAYGTAPNPYNPAFFWLFLLPFILPTIGLIMIFSLTIVSITQLNDNNANGVGLILLTFLANLLWCLIRAALIVVAYICLALEVLTISIIFLGIGVTLDLTSIFSEFECDWGINWAIPYGVDTRIAFIELEMADYNVRVEAYITWTYWEYFDIYFPLLTMDTKLGSILEDFMGDNSNVTTPPELGCGYDHLGGLRYDFHALYRHRPQGYAPDHVTLVLVSPSGNVYNYSMDETPGQSFDTYYNWVRFNRTVDFGQDFDFDQRNGQWHYCFITKASVVNRTTRWPYCGYAIGPLFHDNRNYFLSSYLDPFSGYIDSEFEFTATGCDFLDKLTPEQVYLKLKWPNETITTFPMSLASTYNYEEMSFNTYSRTLNFSNYISIDEPTTLNYYYEAVFSDGSVSVLWDYYTIEDEEDVEPEDEYIDEGIEFEYIPTWFEGPLLKPRVTGANLPPIIWKWYVEDLTWNRLLSEDSESPVLSPVSDEFILRFWVYTEDPDGTHEDHWKNGFEFVPKLTLFNLDHPDDPLKPIDMKWTGEHYGPGPEGYDEYFIDVLGDGHYAYKYEQSSDLNPYNFTSGAWGFSFEVEDNQAHNTKVNTDKRIWHIGSFENMKSTFFYGHPNGVGIEGILGALFMTISYITTTFLAVCKSPKVQVAAQILAATIAAVNIVFDVLAYINFAFTTDDMGSLIGLGFHMFVKSLGFLTALIFSNKDGSGFKFDFVTKFSGFLMALSIIDLNSNVIGINWEENEDGILVPSQENDPPTWNELLGGYPMMIVSFLSSVVGLTSTLVLTSGVAKSSVGTKNIKTVMIVHTFISTLIMGFCFFTYFSKSGFFLLANELITM